MAWFLVWGSRRGSDGGLVWNGAPIAALRADDADAACRSAARRHGSFGTFFALEGQPWGIELMVDDDVEELGAPIEPLSELESLRQRMRELERVAGPDTAAELTTPPGAAPRGRDDPYGNPAG